MNNADGVIRDDLNGLNYALIQIQKVGQFAERFRRFIDYEIQIEQFQGSKKVPEGRQTLEVKDVTSIMKEMISASILPKNIVIVLGLYFRIIRYTELH